MEKSKAECLERLNVIETLIDEYKARLIDLEKEQREVMKELDEYAATEGIIAENEAAENETLIEKDLTMETKTERTGTNDACRTNDEIPKIGEGEPLTVQAAVDEYKKMADLLDPKSKSSRPVHGWADWLVRKIEQRKQRMANFIADSSLQERKAKQ